ncbi:MAG: hypothetical protein G3W58_22865 [Pantoea ananatis]|nr:hypothetical protein [Pantoea ananatis]
MSRYLFEGIETDVSALDLIQNLGIQVDWNYEANSVFKLTQEETGSYCFAYSDENDRISKPFRTEEEARSAAKAWAEREDRPVSIGGIGNYYGCLSVKKSDGKYWWSIENYDGHNWEEIDKSLYDELMKRANK